MKYHKVISLVFVYMCLLLCSLQIKMRLLSLAGCSSIRSNGPWRRSSVCCITSRESPPNVSHTACLCVAWVKVNAACVCWYAGVVMWWANIIGTAVVVNGWWCQT